MMETIARLESINSRQDLVDFIEFLVHDLEVNEKTWENRNLGDYLRGLSGWTQDMVAPSGMFMAQMLLNSQPGS